VTKPQPHRGCSEEAANKSKCRDVPFSLHNYGISIESESEEKFAEERHAKGA
jgi:hypothetical protein